eukprot:759574-Hanusia_phi.AAC.5
MQSWDTLRSSIVPQLRTLGLLLLPSPHEVETKQTFADIWQTMAFEVFTLSLQPYVGWRAVFLQDLPGSGPRMKKQTYTRD